MKEITLDDLKTEINNNLWRVTQLGLQGLGYKVPCYVRFIGDELDVFIISNKSVVKLCSIITKRERFLAAVTLHYEKCKVYSIDIEELIHIQKEEMNKEVFELLQSQDIPF